jgi:4-amino-4-deoxy-L-arabinose transferase-like glycosyltransferase
MSHAALLSRLVRKDRKAAMRITVAIGLGLALAANGLLMLFDPAGWYAVAPACRRRARSTRISFATSAAPTS